MNNSTNRKWIYAGPQSSRTWSLISRPFFSLHSRVRSTLCAFSHTYTRNITETSKRHSLALFFFFFFLPLFLWMSGPCLHISSGNLKVRLSFSPSFPFFLAVIYHDREREEQTHSPNITELFYLCLYLILSIPDDVYNGSRRNDEGGLGGGAKMLLVLILERTESSDTSFSSSLFFFPVRFDSRSALFFFPLWNQTDTHQESRRLYKKKSFFYPLR